MPPELESLWGILEEYFMLEVVPQWDLSVRFEDVALGKTSRGRRILHGTANTPVFSRRSGNYLKKSSENKALLKAVEQTESGCVLRLATCGFSSTSPSFRASAVSFFFSFFFLMFFIQLLSLIKPWGAMKSFSELWNLVEFEWSDNRWDAPEIRLLGQCYFTSHSFSRNPKGWSMTIEYP